MSNIHGDHLNKLAENLSTYIIESLGWRKCVFALSNEIGSEITWSEKNEVFAHKYGYQVYSSMLKLLENCLGQRVEGMNLCEIVESRIWEKIETKGNE